MQEAVQLVQKVLVLDQVRFEGRHVAGKYLARHVGMHETNVVVEIGWRFQDDEVYQFIEHLCAV